MLISLRTATVVLFVFLTAGCKKETETVIVEVDKQYSWREADGLRGWNRFIISTGTDGNSLFLQTPGSFTVFDNQSPSKGIKSYVPIGMPTDVRIRLAISPTFTAYPLNDSTLRICRTREPAGSASSINLRQLDRQATRFQTEFSSLFKCMAISRNNYLLAPYMRQPAGQSIDFVLAAVNANVSSSAISAIPQRVSIPISAASTGAYVRNIAAIDDYFLVNLSSAGIYKIRQDGSYRRVYSYAIADAFYKWKGVVYAPVEYNEILTSTDDGETWRLSTGTPEHFTLATYHTVSDSLVGIFKDNLYTLRWNGSQFKTRFLKNDGLRRVDISGLEVLRDTVYIATTNGLLARPVSSFFESRTQ